MINRKIKYAALLTALTVFTAGCGADNSDSRPSDNVVAENARTIVLDDAKAAALDHAGLSENEVVFVKAKLEHDDGAAEYDIEFTANNFKYEYEIDAIDGKVLEFSFETISEAQNDTGASSAEASVQITIDEAKEIALKHAGIKSSDAVFTKAKSDNDNGVVKYDIEFIANNTEYEYEISASDGSILESSVEAVKNAASVPTAAVSSSQITLDEAKEIALKHAGIKSSDAVFTKAKSDNDDGVMKYDIEFIANNTEYEYEISASDGSILESSAEAVKNAASVPTAAVSSSQITLDEAKAIALEHAGFAADQVVFTKSELDYDDGTAEYEIEFKANGLEYEYTINAYTGKIVEYDIDD